MPTLLEPNYLAEAITAQTGVVFKAETGKDEGGGQWYVLRPQGVPEEHGFGVRTTIDWRRLKIKFEPGKFAGSLLTDMGKADLEGQSAFFAVLADCKRLGAEIEFKVNSVEIPLDSNEVWRQHWKRLLLSINKGQLELGLDKDKSDGRVICEWTSRFLAAVCAILPIDEQNEKFETDVEGYPEGSVISTSVNRYERDRRNRAAAIAIHGTECRGCGLKMEKKYGPIASEFVEIHHIIPVSELGTDYIINPAHDLVPLCPNCHAIVHRKTPALTIDELKDLLI